MLTVYGIETSIIVLLKYKVPRLLQQCLPFTVLKPFFNCIKTNNSCLLQQCLPFTVLKRLIYVNFIWVYIRCNSAYRLRYWNLYLQLSKKNFTLVATVLTVYGIETSIIVLLKYKVPRLLQQCLPFTVLKPFFNCIKTNNSCLLQQCLPFTVLKLFLNERYIRFFSLQQCLPFTVLKPTIWRWTLSIIFTVATVLTVYGIETEFLDI